MEVYLLLVHSNSIVVATTRQHTPVHHTAMCCINAHAGIRLTHPVLYSVGVYTDMPTTCMPSDQNTNGQKFWRGIYFGGLLVLRALCQYFICQNFTVLCLCYCIIIVSTCTIGLQLDVPV